VVRQMRWGRQKRVRLPSFLGAGTIAATHPPQASRARPPDAFGEVMARCKSRVIRLPGNLGKLRAFDPSCLLQNDALTSDARGRVSSWNSAA
jgi:hypothetical protein